MGFIRKKNVIFAITRKDIQIMAFEAIGRKLDSFEAQGLANTIMIAFSEWDNWIKELIERQVGIEDAG